MLVLRAKQNTQKQHHHKPTHPTPPLPPPRPPSTGQARRFLGATARCGTRCRASGDATATFVYTNGGQRDFGDGLTGVFAFGAVLGGRGMGYRRRPIGVRSGERSLRGPSARLSEGCTSERRVGSNQSSRSLGAMIVVGTGPSALSVCWRLDMDGAAPVPVSGTTRASHGRDAADVRGGKEGGEFGPVHPAGRQRRRSWPP